MTSQMSADDTLMIWQANRHLPPEGRIALIEKMEEVRRDLILTAAKVGHRTEATA